MGAGIGLFVAMGKWDLGTVNGKKMLKWEWDKYF